MAAAGDLLATHRDTDGAHRGPTAWLLDEPEVRAAGLGALAHATELVAGDATDLGLRALQAGLEPRRARMQARLPATVGPAARELRSRCSHPGPAHDALADLELARPAIRTDNPIDEFGDRLARLHRAAWQLVREPQVGVTTLTDYAALGVIVHAHAAALLSAPARRAGGDTRDPAADPVLARVQHGGRAWSRLYQRLDDLRTATPGSPGVRSDLLAVRHLLRDHIPLHPSGGSAPAAADRQLIRITLGAVGALDAIAGWNARVFDNLAATRQLHVDGPRLTGDEVTRNDDVVAAKLQGGLAPLPPGRLVAVRDAYRAVADAHPVTPSQYEPVARPSTTPLPPGTHRSAPSA